jgi:hypothetical protein
MVVVVVVVFFFLMYGNLRMSVPRGDRNFCS